MNHITLNALSIEESDKILQMYASLENSQKWVLSSGKVVEDEMEKMALSCTHYHPSQHLILDTLDNVWPEYFTEEELLEIRNHDQKPLPEVPEYLEKYIDSYGGLTTPLELYDHVFSTFQKYKEHNGNTKWVRDIMYHVSNFYIDDFCLAGFDNLKCVWKSIIDGAFLGSSIAVNRKTSDPLEAPTKTSAKLIWVESEAEVGMLESAGYNTIKTPFTLMKMLVNLIRMNPNNKNNMTSTGIILNGKEIQLAMVSVPHNYVFRVSRTPQIEVPSNMSELISGIKLIASTIWKAKAVMNETISAIDSVKDVNSVDE